MAAPFEFSEDQAEHILDMQLSRLTRLGPVPARGGDGAAPAAHRRARGDPRRPRRAHAASSRTRSARSARSYATPASVQDHLRRRRHGHRGPHRRRGPRRHDVGQGLREDRLRRRLPQPGPRRPRRRRSEAARRGLRRPHRHDHRARLPAVLLQPRPRVPPEGARDPDEGAHGSRHRHREPAPAPARRAHPGDHRHPRLRDEPVPVLRHAGRAR